MPWGFAGELYELYVHPRHQGRGHGSALLSHIWQQRAAMGHLWGVLWVLEANAPAQTFYARQGMQIDGNRGRSWVRNQQFPIVRFARPLNPVRFR